jgi:hypothetical protein
MMDVTGNWGQTVFDVLVPLGVFIIGGMLHMVYRLGKLNEEMKRLRIDLDRLRDTPFGRGIDRRGRNDAIDQ